MSLVSTSIFSDQRTMRSLAEVVAKFVGLSPSVVVRGIKQERTAITHHSTSDLAPVYNFLARHGVSLFTLRTGQGSFDFQGYAKEAKRAHQDKRMLILHGDRVGIVDNGRLYQHKQIPNLQDFVAFYMRK